MVWQSSHVEGMIDIIKIKIKIKIEIEIKIKMKEKEKEKKKNISRRITDQLIILLLQALVWRRLSVGGLVVCASEDAMSRSCR